MTIAPFSIATSDDVLDDLRRRLEMTRWPDAETPDDWSQGIPLDYMQRVHDYWLNEYDFRSREATLNRWPAFITQIDGLDIHFLHIRSPREDAKPLLMTHGWPGSVVEFQNVIGPLIDPDNHGALGELAFHVVCPSLPGFAFSGKPKTPGWGINKIAEAWNELMAQLGYSEYLAQGGDWGSIVTTAIGAQNLGQCQGIHITMPVVGPDPDTMNDLTEFETGVSSGLPVLPRPRLRLLQAAKHSPSNVGLRSCRLAHGASRVDSREVLSVDGLQWTT